jgi:DNA-binding SARP family transcriptional activator
MYCLKLFGGASIEGGSGPLAGPVAQRRRLALLALLAVAPTGAVSRERIAALLFPEADAAQSRRGLSDALHAVRRALGKEAVVTVGDELRLNPGVVRSDVAAYEAAVAAGDEEQAVALYHGPFLDGFFVSDAPELERWVEDVRQRLAGRHARLLETAAEAAELRGDIGHAVEWWHRLTQHDPHSSRAALRLCQVLEKHGDPAGALQCARVHAARLRDELGVEAGPEVTALIQRLARPVDAGRHARETNVRTRPADASASEPAPQPTGRDTSPRRRSLQRPAAAVVALAGIVAITAVARFRDNDTKDDVTHGREASASPTVLQRSDAIGRELYERGRLAWGRRTPEGLDEAVGLFRAAIERNPADARAYAGLADAYVMLGYLGFRPAAAMFPKGKAAALHALALDSSVAEAWAPLGQALMWERRWVEAERAFREAIRRNPRDATAHQWYATMLVPLGRIEEAVAELARASELDPLSRQVNNMRGLVLYWSGRPDEALQHYRRFVEAEPDTQWVHQNPWLLSNMSRVYAAHGLHPDALRAVRRALATVPNHPRALLDLASIHVAMGERERALAVFAAADTANGQYAYFRAALFAQLHQPDSAFHWLGRVWEWGPSPMGELRMDPRLAPIRGDPRYRHLLVTLGLTAETATAATSGARSR